MKNLYKFIFIIVIIALTVTGLIVIDKKMPVLSDMTNTVSKNKVVNKVDNTIDNKVENKIDNKTKNETKNKAKNEATNDIINSKKEENIFKSGKKSEKELEKQKEQIEQDELEYGDNYQKFKEEAYKRKPDRIIFKNADENNFFIFEEDYENYDHLLEVCEDRMAYSVMQDYNLYCFTPDSIDTMMISGENYIIFDYDNKGLEENDEKFQKDLIFKFTSNTRLYRLVNYYSNFVEAIPRNKLDKKEFASNTKISGYKYMRSGKSEN